MRNLSRVGGAASALAIGAALIAAVGFTSPAASFPPFLNEWVARYPQSTLPARMEALTGSSCNLCHIPPSRTLDGSCYRLALRELTSTGVPIEEAIIAVEDLDSDGDGVSNLIEITTPRADMRGEVGYNPGLVGPLGVSPCGPTPAEPVTNELETPVVCHADFNDDALVNSQDFFDFLNAFFAGALPADFNHDAFINSQDFFDFLNAFFAGC